MFLAMLCAQLTTVRQLERNPVGIGRSVARLHAIAQFYLIGVVTVTGGLHSPALPAVGASIALPAVFFGRQPISWALMAMQVDAINKSVQLQQRSTRQLGAFLQAEAEKVRHLHSPEELLKFNLQANTLLFGLLKSQGEAFSHLASETLASALEQIRHSQH